MFSRKFLLAQVILLSLLIPWIALKLYHKQQPALPVLGHIQSFSLTNTENKIISLNDLSGKVWVADFIFTTCGSVCPIMTARMKHVYNFFKVYNDVKFISISVNPENDTPDVLKAYAQKNEIDTQRWFFLTGSREDITSLAVKSFKLGDMKEPIFHSPYFALVDRQGQIRGYYDANDKSTLNKLSKDIRQVLMEK